MSVPSLRTQLDKARSLLHELENSVGELPPETRKRISADLQRLVDSFQQSTAGDLQHQENEQYGAGKDIQSRGLKKPPSWLEHSLSHVQVGTWHYDSRTDRLEWSDEMFRLYGLEPGGGSLMTNERFTELVHPEDRERVNTGLQNCMRRAHTYIDEFRVVKPDGNTIWVNSVATMQVDESGRTVHVEGINQDITARKLAEEALRMSQAREQIKAAELQAILDAVPSLVWVSRDPECREIIGSRYGYEFLNMLKGDNLSASAPAEERQHQGYRNFKDGREIPADEMPMQIAARTGIEARDFEYDIKLANGELRHLLGNVMPLLDGEGKPSGAVGAFVDITERKRMEMELRRSEAREKARAAELQAIIDAVPSPIYLTRDKEGYEVTGNLAAYKMMRVEPGTNLSRLRTGLLLKPIRQSLHDGKPLSPQETPLQIALKTGRTITDYEWKLEFEDGSHTILWGSATPIRDEEGGISGAVSVFIDISARTTAEEELRRTVRRNAFRLKLRDALRPLTDPEEIKRTAAEVLGVELGASRVFYAAVLPGDEDVILEPGYAHDVPVLVGRFHLKDFARHLFEDHPRGHVYTICDIPNDPKLTKEQREAYLGVQVQAHMDVPLIKDERFTALLSVHQSTPRNWTEDEILMAVETAERTWANVGRARAEAALRESEARFHASVESLMEGFVLYSAVRQVRIDGKPGKILDLRYDYVNQGACLLANTKREEMVGRTLLEVLPKKLAQELLERYIRVIETGEPLSERATFGEDGEEKQVFDIRAVKMGDGVVVTRSDVTEQVRADEERRYALTQMEIHHRLAEQSEKERQSYARELHDGPVQILASMAYNLQYVKEVFPDKALRKELDQISSSLRSAVQELRQVINELRPPAAIQLGLAKAIGLHAEDIQQRCPTIQWTYNLADDGSMLPVPVCLAMFRIYQEATNNIIRHSEATCAEVKLGIDKDLAILEIADNGKGLPEIHDLDSLTRSHHFGLAGMSERAEEINAKLDIYSEPGKGTRLQIAVSLQPESEQRKSATVPRRRL